MGKARFREQNNNWRGGKSLASNGYVLIRVGVGHPLADVRGYAYEHRVVAEAKVGRPLAKGEQVHHIDGNRQNNHPHNLEVLTVAEHHAEHRTGDRGLRMPGEDNTTIECACGCGSPLTKYDGSNRPRSFLSGHNPMPSPTLDAITKALVCGPADRATLAEATGRSVQAIGVALSKLKHKGTVVSRGRGVWSLADEGDRRAG